MREFTPEEKEIVATWEQTDRRLETLPDGSGVLVFTYSKNGHEDKQIRFSIGCAISTSDETTSEDLMKQFNDGIRNQSKPKLSQHAVDPDAHKHN